MRRYLLLLFGLALLLCAAAPGIEPLDRWDHTPTLAADSEFHVAAFAALAGLAVLLLLVTERGLRGLRWSVVIALSLKVLGMVFATDIHTVRANGPPGSFPLRI
jgi:hypothetical protein